MSAFRDHVLSNSIALAESPKSSYRVNPISFVLCIVVVIGLVVSAITLCYIIKRIHSSLQKKILDELDDVEAYTFKVISPITPPPRSRSSTRKSAFTDFCRTVDSPTAKYEQATRRSPVRLFYPHPAPRVVPVLPTVPQPVHSSSSPTSQRLAYLTNTPQAAKHTSAIDARDSGHFISETEGNSFSMVADTVVGVYPISIVHPVVKTYEVHTHQLPHSSVLGSIFGTLDEICPVSVPTPRKVMAPPATLEKASVLVVRDINSRALISPAPGRKSLHGSEPGMRKLRKAKRYQGKENKSPIGRSVHPAFA